MFVNSGRATTDSSKKQGAAAERGRGAAKQGCGHEGRCTTAVHLAEHSSVAVHSEGSALLSGFAFAVARSLSHTSTLPVVGEGFSMHGMGCWQGGPHTKSNKLA